MLRDADAERAREAMTLYRAREAYEREELERLAPAAVKSAQSRGRLHPEPEHAYRTAFQRDRDRIVHSRAFRRLEYKTQVFVHHDGDHYRNRLTHTLEGAQIARTIARALRLNEDLAEAIVLAHDLGHTPFGHAGERVLDRLDEGRRRLRPQSPEPAHRRLARGPLSRISAVSNLTFETREGMLKHGSPLGAPGAAARAGGAAARSRRRSADTADEIAYTNHDLDDGLRLGPARRPPDSRTCRSGATRSAPCASSSATSRSACCTRRRSSR